MMKTESESEKLAKMAACIAHEIRNPLAGISSTAQVLESKLPRGDHRRECVEIILEEITRLEGIVQRFLHYARPTPAAKYQVDLNELVEKTIFLQKKQLERRHMSIFFEVNPSIPNILCDGEQIKQIILNCLINAMNAMGTHAGRIDVFLSEREGMVQVEIRDQGPGINAEDIEHIFEPFYSTTKKGIGLGLAISHQIASEHGGDLKVHNLETGGACFTLVLPLNAVLQESGA